MGKMATDDGIGVREMCCPVCGKVFAVMCPENWVYRYKFKNAATVYYCSYSCSTKAEREREEAAGRRAGVRAQQRAKRLERGMYIAAMRDADFTYEQIAAKLDVSKKYVEQIYAEYLNYKSREEIKHD